MDFDRRQAALWAKELVERQNWCVLDTETTGLDSSDQICQIAITAPDGAALINSLVKPTIPISKAAQAIHGITGGMVADAPTFEELLVPILKAVGNRDLIIYNAEFDLRLIRQSARAHDIHLAPALDCRGVPIWIGGGVVHCAMKKYSNWVGDWSDYHGNYRWQRLPGGDHTALGDCLATLEVIRRMAASYEPEALPAPQLATYKPLEAKPENIYDDIPF